MTVIYISLGVAACFLLLRFVGSLFATEWANRKLAALPRFQGKVAEMRLIPWRRSIVVHGLVLTDREHARDGPVLRMASVRLIVGLRPLLRGCLGGQCVTEGVEVVVTKRDSDGANGEDRAASLFRSVRAVLRQAFPIDVTRFEIKDAMVRFDDRTRPQSTSLFVDRIWLRASFGGVTPVALADFPAELELRARVAGSGRLSVTTRANPASIGPRFYAKMELRDLSLPEIHDFLRTYALIDVRRGSFEMSSEVLGTGDHYTGYLKPSFKDLEFEAAAATPDPNLVQRVAARVTKSITWLLHDEKGSLATNETFEGNFPDRAPDANWVLVENLLHASFVQALRKGLKRQRPTPALPV